MKIELIRRKSIGHWNSEFFLIVFFDDGTQTWFVVFFGEARVETFGHSTWLTPFGVNIDHDQHMGVDNSVFLFDSLKVLHFVVDRWIDFLFQIGKTLVHFLFKIVFKFDGILHKNYLEYDKYMATLLERMKKQRELQAKKPTLNIVEKKERKKPTGPRTQNAVKRSTEEEELLRKKLQQVLDGKTTIERLLKQSNPFSDEQLLKNISVFSKQAVRNFLEDYLGQTGLSHQRFYPLWVEKNKEFIEKSHRDPKKQKKSHSEQLPIRFLDNSRDIISDLYKKAREYTISQGLISDEGYFIIQTKYDKEGPKYLKVSEKGPKTTRNIAKATRWPSYKDADLELKKLDTFENAKVVPRYSYVIQVEIEPGVSGFVGKTPTGDYDTTTKLGNAVVWDTMEEAIDWLNSPDNTLQLFGKVIPKLSYLDYISLGDKGAVELHSEIAEPWLLLAEELGIFAPHEIPVQKLAEEIASEERKLASKVSATLADKIDGMSREDLMKKIRSSEKYEDYPTKVLKVILLRQTAKIGTLTTRNLDEEDLKKLKKKYLEKSPIQKELPEHHLKSELIRELTFLTGEMKSKYKNFYSIRELERLNRVEKLKLQRPDSQDDISGSDGKELLGSSCDLRSRSDLKFSKSFKWIPYPVTSVWLSPYEMLEKNGEIIGDFSSISKYVVSSQPGIQVKAYKEMDTVLWEKTFYKANQRFFREKCIFGGEQKGDVFILGTRPETTRCYVGFTVYTKDWTGYTVVKPKGVYSKQRFMLQTDEMYENEKLHLSIRTHDQEYKDFLTQPLSVQLKQIVSEYISRLFIDLFQEESKDEKTELADFVAKTYYQPNGEFIQTIIRIASGGIRDEKTVTNEYFLQKVVPLIVYLNMKEAKIFKKRIVNEYYLPDVLLELSDKDKLPEVFVDHVSPEMKNLFSSKIKASIDLNTRKLAMAVVYPNQTLKTQSTVDPIVELRNVDYLCVNPQQIEGVPENQIVHYKDPESGLVYCFGEEFLLKRFKDKDYTNPDTNQKFSKEFMSRYVFNYKGVNYPVLQVEKWPKKKLYGLGDLGDYTPMILKINPSLIQCENPEWFPNDIEPEKLISVKEDGKRYCFTIEQMRDLLRHITPTNPITDRRFSKKEIDRFQNQISVRFHNKGFLQKKFADEYDFRLPRVRKNAQVEPWLWDLVTKDLSERSSVEKLTLEDFGLDEDEEAEVDVEKSEAEVEEAEEKEPKVEVKKDKKKTVTQDSVESEISSVLGFSSQIPTLTVPQKVDSRSTKVEPVLDSTSSASSTSSDSGSTSNSTSSASSKDTQKGKSHPTICTYCKKKEGLFKSIGYQTKPEVYYFCCPNCMEKYDFPKFKIVR